MAFLLVWHDQDFWANYMPDTEEPGADIGAFAALAGVDPGVADPNKKRGRFNPSLGLWIDDEAPNPG